MADYQQYRGTLPYASELFGVYQPLLGWKSRCRMQRVAHDSLAALKQVVSGASADHRVGQLLVGSSKPFVPTDPVPPRPPLFLHSDSTTAVVAHVHALRTSLGREPTPAELAKLIDHKELTTHVKTLSDRMAAAQRSVDALEGTRATAKEVAPAVVHEAVVAGALQYMSTHAPAVLSHALLGSVARWQLQANWVDPLANFDVASQRAYLSPVGLINLYREYFFELDTFLGPPVGHVWVSPGGSLEVYEVQTTRSQEERSVEQSEETTTSSEKTLATQDELSSAVSKSNNQNMSVGVTASGGVNFAVFQASASASFNFSTAQSVAQQDAHKQTRTQTEKIASEVRKNFKTTFKTTVSDEHVSSRRYVLQNTTDKLVNYELRRKMRKIAVQVQHIGTQLCWEIFIDDPGRELGIAELVHVAQPDDPSAVQPPEFPTALLPQEVPFQVSFPFRGVADNDDRTDDYVNGRESGDDDADAHKIDNRMTVKVAPPAAGYKLSDITVTSYTAPDASADVSAAASFEIDHAAGDTFTMVLDEVQFDDQSQLLFTLRLLWAPPDPNPSLKDYEKAKEEYTAAKRKQEHQQYISEVRARVEAAGQVQTRPTDELREEERTVVFRRLIRQLMKPADHQTVHVATELIRGLFDVDKMLYFVAPDWWIPRERHHQSMRKNAPPPKRVPTGKADSAPVDVVGSSDLIAWGGEKELDRDNYFVTENSNPAPLGASLGWLLQLDADSRRNAFLNAPWVKAVIPIRPGREHAALDWLTKAHVEGSDGLDAVVDPAEIAGMGPGVHTIRDAIYALAAQVSGGQTMDNTLASESVFENGFDPLEGGFKAAPFAVFDQWIEVMPTDQVVAIEYPISPQP